MEGKKPGGKKQSVQWASNPKCVRCGHAFPFSINDVSDFIRNRLDLRYRDEYLQFFFPGSIQTRSMGVRYYRSLNQFITANCPYCREVDMGYPSDDWPPTLGSGSSLPGGFQVISL
jgi:Zn ribbon nucleic-acid-binding protein